MRDSMKRQAANEEAENRWFRKAVSGSEDPVEPGADDEMGNVMLGDIHHPAPVVIAPPPQQSNTIQTALLATALAAATGIGGYLLANNDKPDASVAPPVQPTPGFDDESVSIGLGRLEDYLDEPGSN